MRRRCIIDACLLFRRSIVCLYSFLRLPSYDSEDIIVRAEIISIINGVYLLYLKGFSCRFKIEKQTAISQFNGFSRSFNFYFLSPP